MKPLKKTNYKELEKVLGSMKGYKYIGYGKAHFYTLNSIFTVDLTATKTTKKDIAYTTIIQLASN